MKVKCIKSYIDKHTMKPVKVGNIYEVDSKRFRELTKSEKYVEEIKTTEPVETDETSKTKIKNEKGN